MAIAVAKRARAAYPEASGGAAKGAQLFVGGEYMQSLAAR